MRKGLVGIAADLMPRARSLGVGGDWLDVIQRREGKAARSIEYAYWATGGSNRTLWLLANLAWSMCEGNERKSLVWLRFFYPRR